MRRLQHPSDAIQTRNALRILPPVDRESGASAQAGGASAGNRHEPYLARGWTRSIAWKPPYAVPERAP